METVIVLHTEEPSTWLSEFSETLAQRPGYSVTNLAGDALRVERSYWSDNRLAGSLILGFLTAGFGFLLLSTKDKESFEISVTRDPASSGAVARLAGVWSADTTAIIAEQTADAHLTGHTNIGREPTSASPIRAADDTDVAPPTQEAAKPAVVENDQGSTYLVDATRRVPAPVPPAPGFALLLDNGEKWPIAEVNVVGRGPSVPADTVVHAQLIRIEDPTHSVSKNHSKIVLEGQGVRIFDMGSTNGTVVVLVDGQRLNADTENGVLVPDGASVEIGERSFALVPDSEQPGA